MLKKIAVASFITLNIAASASAQSGTQLNGQRIALTTAVPFLRISPDARSGAMGDVGIAISPDANAQYWNVGKIPFAEKQYGVSLNYTPWLKDLVPDINLLFASGYAKFGKDNNQAISASIRYFSLGTINFTDNQGASMGSGQPNEYAVSFGYSRRLSQYLSAGVNLRYIHSSLFSTSLSNYSSQNGTAIAGDVGLYYTKTTDKGNDQASTFSAGAVISNLGSKISYGSSRRDFIPTNLGLGAAYTYKVDMYNKFTVAVDVNKLLVPGIDEKVDSLGNMTYSYPDKSVMSGVFSSFGDPYGIKRLNASVGAEYWYQDQFAVRAGYYYEHKDNGDRRYFSCGLGVRYTVFAIDAAYLVPSGSGITRNPLSNTVRFSLSFNFNNNDKVFSDNKEG
jgi:hypothetical protein